MLPSILEVARQEGLEINDRTFKGKEVRSKCPFCKADAGRRGKYYLSLNTSDNVFKCWICGEAGGVLKFMALLQNISVEEVKRNLFSSTDPGKKKRRKRKLHPAEKLTPSQLDAMGITGPSWYELRKRDYQYYKRTLTWVWREWKEHVVKKKQDAYAYFYMADSSKRRIEVVKEFAEKLSLKTDDLMLEFTSLIVSSKKPKWAIEAENYVEMLKESCKKKQIS